MYICIFIDVDQIMLFFFTVGSILIFVTRKSNAEELVSNLQHKDFSGQFFFFIQIWRKKKVNFEFVFKIIISYSRIRKKKRS